jgi:hypothetical protein
MWDLLVTLGTLVFIPALLPTVLDSRTYIPRKTSAVSVLGLVVVVVGLSGSGLVLRGIVSSVVTGLWAFIFLFRGKEPSGEAGLSD